MAGTAYIARPGGVERVDLPDPDAGLCTVDYHYPDADLPLDAGEPGYSPLLCAPVFGTTTLPHRARRGKVEAGQMSFDGEALAGQLSFE